MRMHEFGSAVNEHQAKRMVINEIAPAELERMRQATRPVAEKFRSQSDSEVVMLYEAEIANARAGTK